MSMTGLAAPRCLRIFLVLTVLLPKCSTTQEPQSHNAARKENILFPSHQLASHSRVSKICSENFQGLEGFHIKGFQLQKTLVLITPGLQTPDQGKLLGLFGQNDFSNFCNFRQLVKSHKSEKIQSYPDVLQLKEKVRGEVKKSGLKILNPLVEENNCRSRGLSAFGVLQSIHLGEYLLQAYFGKLKGLRKHSPSMGLAATTGDETLYQSLNAVLYGLLTEKQFLKFNIAKASSDFCSDSQCRFPQDLHFYIEQSLEKENHFFKDSKVTNYRGNHPLGQKLNSELASKDLISHLINKLCIQTLGENDLAFQNLSSDDLDDIFEISDRHIKYLTRSSIFQTYSNSRTRGFRHYLKQWLLPIVQQKHDKADSDIINDEDFKMISVNDLFMLSILKSMNISISEHMFPLSRLVLETFILQLPQAGVRNPESDRAMDQDSVRLIKLKDKPHSQPGPQDKLRMHNDDYSLIGDSLNKDTGLKIGLDKDTTSPLLSALPKAKSHNDQTDSPLRTIPSLYSVLKSSSNTDLPLSIQKSDNIPQANKPESQRFVRVLFNGQVVTSSIAGCENDAMLSLGLCSMSKLEETLELVDRQQDVRDEL